MAVQRSEKYLRELESMYGIVKSAENNITKRMSHTLEEWFKNKYNAGNISVKGEQIYAHIGDESKLIIYLLSGYRGENKEYDTIYRKINEIYNTITGEEVKVELENTKKAGKYVVVSERLEVIQRLLKIYKEVYDDSKADALKKFFKEIASMFIEQYHTQEKEKYYEIINREETPIRREENNNIVYLSPLHKEETVSKKPVVSEAGYARVEVLKGILGVALLGGMMLGAYYIAKENLEKIHHKTTSTESAIIQEKNTKAIKEGKNIIYNAEKNEVIIKKIAKEFGCEGEKDLIMKKDEDKTIVWCKGDFEKGLWKNDTTYFPSPEVKQKSEKIKDVEWGVYSTDKYVGYGAKIDQKTIVWIASIEKEKPNEGVKKATPTPAQKQIKVQDQEQQSTAIPHIPEGTYLKMEQKNDQEAIREEITTKIKNQDKTYWFLRNSSDASTPTSF